MKRSMSSGVLAGLLAPVAFVAAFVYWIYRLTERVPFPIRRVEGQELTIGLVEPESVPGLWEQWTSELQPLIERVRVTVAELTSSF